MIELLLKYADTYGSLFPLATFLVIFRKIKYPDYCVPLVGYFILSILVFGFSNYLADRSINNMLVYNVFALLELVFLSWFFNKVFSGHDRFRFITLALFVVFWILNILFLEKFSSMNSNVIAVEFLIVIIYCFRYYIEFSKTDQIISFYKEPLFWIVSGFFVYFSLSVMVVVFYKYATRDDNNFILSFWKLQVIMYLIKNILIAKGLLCFKVSK